jgi:hypothetical protein
LARDRLAGLAQVRKPFIAALEQGRLPTSASATELHEQMSRICRVLATLWDEQLLPWLPLGRAPTGLEMQRASLVVTDRRCHSVADLILRQAHRRSQIEQLVRWLTQHGYRDQLLQHGCVTELPPGTFTLEQQGFAGRQAGTDFSFDAVVRPHSDRNRRLPVFLDLTFAGDTSAVKLAKEETRGRLLKQSHGEEVIMLAILSGSFDKQYLDARAACQLDWVWAHRLDDLALAGLTASPG